MSAYGAVDCPECGGKMVSRKRKSDGQRFWGCADYPRCKGTRNTDGEARRVLDASSADETLSPSERARTNDRARWRHQG